MVGRRENSVTLFAPINCGNTMKPNKHTPRWRWCAEGHKVFETRMKECPVCTVGLYNQLT